VLKKRSTIRECKDMRAKRHGDLLYHSVTDRKLIMMPTLSIFQKQLEFYEIRSPFYGAIKLFQLELVVN